MHFMPDTEDEDSAAERFWPEGYKQVLREGVPPFVRQALLRDKPFQSVYEQGYKGRFSDHTEFLEKLADLVAAGAENGADDAFDDIINAFLKEASLPPLRQNARYQEPQPLSDDLRARLRQSIIGEYSQDNIYVYAYGVGYRQTYPTFEDYINRVVDLVVAGTENGANDTLESAYRSMSRLAPLLPVRRRPRRLKMW